MLPQQQQQQLPFNGFQGGMVPGFNQLPVMPFNGMQYAQNPSRGNTVPTNSMGGINAAAAPQGNMAGPPARASGNNVGQMGGVAQGGNNVSGANTNVAQAVAGGEGHFNTSPFAFNPTSQSIGEFWSMLELPPAFLQQ